MHSLEEICNEFNLKSEEILNAYCYGSKVYGTDDENSDSDYILVHKKLKLDDGSFKQNARTNDKGDIQIINYSRSGFMNGLQYYDISVLECLFLPNDFILKEDNKFGIPVIKPFHFKKEIIKKSSNSWYLATRDIYDDDVDFYWRKKDMYHSIRILDFAIQLAENNKIDFTTAKKIKEYVDSKDSVKDVKEIDAYRLELQEKLKKII